MSTDNSTLRGPGRNFIPNEATRRRNPAMFGVQPSPTGQTPPVAPLVGQGRPITRVPKPRLNKTEARYRDILLMNGRGPILEQAITLRLDPPFRSYKPDLGYLDGEKLVLVEVKGPHRFREKGIAKAALAAKTYPQFRFELADWKNGEWKESVLSP